MLTVYSEDHRLHHGTAELIDGKLVPPFEKPERAEIVLARVRESGLGEVRPPQDFGTAPLARVHAENFLTFLETAWEAWVAQHGDYDALPLAWPIRGLRSDREPDAIDGKLSYFSFDAGTPITAGTWRAITASANVALTGQALVAGGARAAFSLCRPPGHHAARDYYGGYCFLNNAAIAAQAFRDGGAERVALLDVDYHHGNGSQSIFYDRGDVFFASIHGDPRQEFPYFLGYADETGEGAGEGCTANYPLAWCRRRPGLATRDRSRCPRRAGSWRCSPRPRLRRSRRRSPGSRGTPGAGRRGSRRRRRRPGRRRSTASRCHGGSRRRAARPVPRRRRGRPGRRWRRC